MATLEAVLKDNQTITLNNYAILYFPKLRSLTHSIFTGKVEVINSLTDYEADLSILQTEFDKIVQEYTTEHPITVTASFTEHGISFVANIKGEDGAITQVEYAELKWDENKQQMLKLAYALCELTTQCMRTLPGLANNPKHFKFINNIDTNPIYDHVVFVYCMYLKLGIHESLLKSFLQMIPSTRKVTYTMIIQNLKCGITLPSLLIEHYENKESLVVRDTYTKDQDGVFQKDGGYNICLSIITYAGQKLFHKLSLTGSPKREYSESSRYVELESTLPGIE